MDEVLLNSYYYEVGERSFMKEALAYKVCLGVFVGLVCRLVCLLVGVSGVLPGLPTGEWVCSTCTWICVVAQHSCC